MFHDVVACSGGCGKARDMPGQNEWMCDECEARDELERAWEIYEYYLHGGKDE